ncbi:MAG TPA: transglutaminase-like domain-containing protein [Draconibacterium sp.]|nr:transglutaminase-like domain-containing protein [Draconibacterium sp.]
MNKFLHFLVINIFIFSFLNCTKKRNDLDEIKYQFLNGNFRYAIEIIEEIESSGISKDESSEIEIIEAKIERIQIDFSKNETQIKDELKPWFPNLSDEQLRRWEDENTLEMRLINGEQRYFKNAVNNLFRLDSAAKMVKEKNTGKTVDPLDDFCLQHTSKILQEFNSNVQLIEKPQKYRIDFSITIKPDVIPAGETVKCWMPFPRESLPRQKNVKLLDVNSESYHLAENDYFQRSLYFEKITEAGKPTVFNYSAEFETSAQYFKLDSAKILEYDKNSENYKKFTAERKPHLIFSNEIKEQTKEITSGLSNPYEKTKAIYYWINNHITWASALEYSTFECIPEYVLRNKQGDCGMQTLLFMSMARYAGIPCKWQSGWMLHPGHLNLHDWCEVYYEGIGWVPLDQSFGLQNSENLQLKEFYISGIDEFRLIINDNFSCDFYPEKQFYRSEPIDFQRGELEWKGGNIYFNQWDYHLDITYLN